MFSFISAARPLALNSLRVVALILGMAACGAQQPLMQNYGPVSLPVPADAQKVEWSSDLQQSWGELESCLGRSAEQPRLFIAKLSSHKAGYYSRDAHAIVINVQHVNNRALWLHELSHAIVGPGHPEWAFNALCGNLPEADPSVASAAGGGGSFHD